MGTDIDDFSDLMPADFSGESGGALEGLDAYKKYEIDQRTQTIKNQAQTLVKSLLDVYFDTDIIGNEEYVQSIAKVESANLAGLLESARYSQHAVSTLMRKIDAGLHADMSVYPILIELQKNAIDIQMKVAQYTRTLSPYLRSLREDIDEGSSISVLSKVEDDDIMEDEVEQDSTKFRGSMAMNKYFQDKLNDIESRKAERAKKAEENKDDEDYTTYEEIISGEEE